MKLPPHLLLALLLSGCGGPPTRFYTLSMSPGAAVSGCRDQTLAVNHVLLPETLDRQSIVRALGPDRLEISNRDRWASPLDGMMQRVLAEDLRGRLPPGSVLAPGDPAPPDGAMALEVNVRHFIADPAGHVTLAADWALLDPHGKELMARSEDIHAGSTPATSTVVSSMSEALGTLADRIARQAPEACAGGETGADTRN